MDEELSELERRYRDDPSERDVAARYEQALRRAGERARVDELYRLAFRCPLAWGALEGDTYDTIRACATCRRDVYYVRTREEMARWVALGECVAIDPEVVRESIRVLADAEVTELARTEGDPCVLEVSPGEGPESLEGLRGMILPPRQADPPSPEDQAAIRELLEGVEPLE